MNKIARWLLVWATLCGGLASALMAPPSLAQAPEWVAVGPYGGRVLALALSPHFATDGTMMASTFGGGLFGSTDGGASWSAAQDVPADMTISALVFSPLLAEDGLVYLSSTQNGVLRSEDGGQSWTAWSTGLESLAVTDLAISPDFGDDQVLLAATGRGLARTPSAGKRWFSVGPAVSALSVAIAPSGEAPFVAFGGTSIGLYRSDDGGETWAPTTLNGIPVLDIAPSPSYASDTSVLVGTLAGAYLSSDGGETWDGPWLGEQTAHSVALAPDYAGGGTIYVGTDQGFYATSDQGQTWRSAAGLTQAVNALLPTADGSALYAGCDGSGIYRSEDGGYTWAERNEGLLGVSVETVATAPSFAWNPVVLAGGPDGLYRSADGGESWQMTMADAEVHAIAFPSHYLATGTVYAATSGGLLISPDRGMTWQASAGSPAVLNILDLALSSDLRDIWLATAEHGVYYSRNAGATWEQRSSGMGSLQATALTCLGGSGDAAQLVVGTWGAGTYVTANGGQSWTASADGPDTPHIQDLASAVGFGGRTWVFASTTAGLFRSGDGGHIWDFAGLLGQDLSSVALHPDYASRANAYVSGVLDGVFRSLNGGLTWQPLNDGLSSLRLNQVVVTTNETAPLLYAAGQNGVWRYGAVPERPPLMELRLPLVWNS